MALLSVHCLTGMRYWKTCRFSMHISMTDIIDKSITLTSSTFTWNFALSQRDWKYAAVFNRKNVLNHLLPAKTRQETLSWYHDALKSHGTSAPKCIIFCRCVRIIRFPKLFEYNVICLMAHVLDVHVHLRNLLLCIYISVGKFFVHFNKTNRFSSFLWRRFLRVDAVLMYDWLSEEHLCFKLFIIYY